MKKFTLVSVALIASFVSSAAFAQMSVEWNWKKEHRCTDVSPALTILGVPEGAKTLQFQMNDLDFQNKDHGGGSVESAGAPSQEIPEGALKTRYIGPCPNNFSSFGHAYQITVRAVGADGAELGKAVKSKDFNAQTAK